jgi:hypothetical protein
MSTIKLNTGVCLHCGQNGFIEMSEDDYTQGMIAYKQGSFVQQAFPNLCADQREQIISGTHPECWLEMFQEKEF